LPNLLSALRLLSVPVLLVLAVLGIERVFAWWLVAAMLTDTADGWIARAFGLKTKLGSFLDSVADSALSLVTLYGVWVFHRYVYTEHALLCLTAAGLWLLEMACSLARYGRLSSFHTYLSKASGVVLGVFFGVLFLFGFQAWLFYLALAATIASSLEELALLAVFPEWRTDVRGLWWVLRGRRVR
jgi:CDP-diacylglycerol--glycerol-3-phosphate 3-phosphatidyltransferase